MVNPEVMVVFWGLASAVTWGAGDFSGGVATKRTAVTGVVVVSQIVGGIFLVLLALLFREALPTPASLLMGMLAGMAGVVGLLALYSGLANGRMGVVAPLAAVISAAIPVLVSLFIEGLPQITQLMGFGLALLAVWLLSGMGWRTAVPRQELGYALVAGTGFALFFIFIDRVEPGSLFWPLATARTVSVTLLSLWVLSRGEWVRPLPHQLPLIALAGVLDALGNAFFALAARLGRLDIAAVLASLYPGSTVLLARVILQERLTRLQWLGVLLALAALVLITL
ncbi:MAG: DMT family transporter [Chloroflexi bacterium]|nr:DMT family transporter [Ardenticatenaceae bacterium]MBL1128839.1 DMT family transporter [Chloroflexota bacterium]NOG34916.1 DMT family transporter [Chloroflexota bacterium]